MSTNYPGALDSYATHITGETIGAALINNPQAAIQALEKYGYSVFNAKTQYGAKGDGTTDDTTPLNNWLAGASGGGATGLGVAYLPPGNYKVTGTLQPPTTLSSGLVIVGSGRAITTITQATANTDTLKVTKGPGRVTFCSLQDLSIVGPNTGTSGYGINLEGDVTLARVEVKQCWTAMRLLNCFYGEAEDCFFGSAIQDGLFLDTGTTTWHGRGNRYSGNGRYGIYSPGNTGDVKLVNDYIESNTTAGAYLDGGAGTKYAFSLLNCYFESPSGTPTELYIGPTTAPHAVSIVGNRFNDEGANLIHCRVGHSIAVLLAGNYFGQVGASGQSLQMDATALGVMEIGNYYWQTPNRVAGASGIILGEPNNQSGGSIGAHLSSYGPAPTISAVNAGISGTPTVVGSDRAGKITLTTTGSPPTSGTKLFTVTFNRPYGNTPVVVVQSQNATTSLLVAANVASGTFDVYATLNLPTSASLSCGYMVDGQT